ncbi:hypothetical protein EVAR_21257_1 [Eumeta japonica]|uniref:Uncharacterized protein n=1 Tax=Eumeta variegata TaxID=151549 RepID=A0A4C1WKZ4_EUMVA|nr:hypothetical protein EVAR_21257_1 [Eumeta japonica]
MSQDALKVAGSTRIAAAGRDSRRPTMAGWRMLVSPSDSRNGSCRLNSRVNGANISTYLYTEFVGYGNGNSVARLERGQNASRTPRADANPIITQSPPRDRPEAAREARPTPLAQHYS